MFWNRFVPPKVWKLSCYKHTLDAPDEMEQMTDEIDRIVEAFRDRKSTTSAIISGLANDEDFLFNIHKPRTYTWEFLPYSLCLHHLFLLLIAFKEYIDPCCFILNIWSNFTLTIQQRSAFYDILTKWIPAHSIFCLENISFRINFHTRQRNTNGSPHPICVNNVHVTVVFWGE